MNITARCQQSGEWWAVDIPEVDGAHTQVTTLANVPAMAADAVGLLLGIDPTTITVIVEYH